MATMIFLKAVLSGEKKLLKVRDVQAIPKIPKYSEIDVKALWKEVRINIIVAKFFSDAYVLGNNTPDRTYFFTLV